MATAKDAPLICDFNVAMAYETEHTILDAKIMLAGVNGLMNHLDRGYYAVAEVKDRVAASLMVTKEWSDWRNGFFWWIQSVYVLPEFRRRGLYSSMYKFVKTLSESDPEVCGYRLYVERNNKTAQAAYENLGMAETHYKLYEELKAISNE
mgnify:CR=1 FL=1